MIGASPDMSLVATQRQITPGNDIFRWGCWFVILNLLDGFQTMAVVGRFGLRAELNPWMGWWIEQYSFQGLWLVKLSIMAAVLLLSTRLSSSVLKGVSLGLSAIVLVNFMTLLNVF
ncbi:MAG: DUF5658 family protein [Planctomycetota bacterium]